MLRYAFLLFQRPCAERQASSENVVLSDTLGYQALNARAAKDALIQRTAILEDSQSAIKNAINKRRNVERMKGSSNINPAKVDDAIAEMEEVRFVSDGNERFSLLGQLGGGSAHQSPECHLKQPSHVAQGSLPQRARGCGVSAVGECSAHCQLSQTHSARA